MSDEDVYDQIDKDLNLAITKVLIKWKSELIRLGHAEALAEWDRTHGYVAGVLSALDLL
jgi:hypothetical protein